MPTAEQQAALDRINYYRKLAGVPVARLNEALMQSATAHAKYVEKHGWVGNPHEQAAGKDGFVGVSMQDRARKFGYGGWVNENMSTLGSPVAAVDGLMNTVSHRTPILEPAYTDIGYGFATGTNKVDVIAFGTTGSYNFNPPLIQWPPNNYTSFGTSFHGESPNPLPGASFPVGNPITLTYRGPGKDFQNVELVAEECQLLDQNGTKLEIVTGKGNFFTTRGTLILAAKKPLVRDRSYVVTMTYKIDGQKDSRTWTFSTGVNVSAVAPLPLPKGLEPTPTAIRDLWRQVDGPVAANRAVGRSWLYGPDLNHATDEEYSESPGGKRNVWYFDKVRLEITRPDGDAKSEWYVTSGHLPKELMTGRIQVGDSKFKEGRSPANLPVAGDSANNPNAPTYATFSKVASLNNDRRAPDRTGQTINETLNAAGVVWSGQPASVKYALYDKTLGHNVADVFASTFKSLPRDWLFIVGLPLSEPYWAKVKLAGVEKDVLIQVFERRVMTYTPSNPAEWRVEMGNVGLHYRLWRYS